MRVRTTGPLALLVATGLTLAAISAGGVAGACPGRPGCVAQQLPAPVTIGNGRVSYRIAPTGAATRLGPPRSAYPSDAIWFPGTGTWYSIVRGHLVVGRDRRPLWRSRAMIAQDRLGLVAAGPGGVAFQHDHRLYVARLAGAERPVARRELPLGWTSQGLYTYSYPRRELLLRDHRGAILKTIAQRPLEYQYDRASQSVYFLSHGALIVVHGTAEQRLATLAGLRMSTNVWLQPLAGKLVELLDDSRLTVLRQDGSLLAWTSVRRLDRISSLLAIAPGARAVAFTGVTGPSAHPDAESVYVLRPGAHAALPVHRQRGSFDVCEEWADLQWHARWLLYSDNIGHLAAIDTAGAHRTIRLSGLAQRLLGRRRGLAAHWSP